MSVVVIREDTGAFLDQVRGESRSWTPDIDKAQVFQSAGKAKVAYNHVTAYDRRYAACYAERVKAALPVSSFPRPIPPFAVREVRVVLA